MSKPRAKSYDVFLSFAQADRGEANVVKRAFEDRGLSVFSTSEFPPGEVLVDLIHSAIVDARVFVAILSRVSVDSPWVTIELGSALGWGMPIYLLLKEGIEPSALQAPFARHPAFPLSDLDVAIDEIARGIDRLDDRQVKRLGELYADTGVPVAKLVDDPDEMDKLARRFNRAVGAKLSPERVLQEVIRLRKRGALPKLKQQTG